MKPFLSGSSIRAPLVLTLLLSPLLAWSQSVIHVKSNATGNNNGSSWANAYIDLQDALTAATSGSEIWVAAGTYRPITPVDSNNVTLAERDTTFQLKNGVAIYGGFAGVETSRSQRNWQANPTILSGDINNNGDLNGNSLTVVTGSGTDNTAVLDGFTVTGGNADAEGLFGATVRGGGMYNDGGSPTLSHIIFSGNSASFVGGGMHNERQSRPVLNQVSFISNSAAFGGGLDNEASTPSLTNVVFQGNRGDEAGGGINNFRSSSTMINVSFSGNTAGRGGGMHNEESSPRLINASFSGNLATSGAGMYNVGSSASPSSPVIDNSIFWNNDSAADPTNNIPIQNEDSNANPMVRFSLVQNCSPNGQWNHQCGSFGDSNTNLPDADPLFIMPVDLDELPNLSGNLRLRVGSPAIDAGSNDFNSSAADLASNVRIVQGLIDLGAFEAPATSCQEVVHVAQTASQPGDGSGWQSAFRNLQDALRVNNDCQIWVAAGTYTPSTDPTDRAATFQLKNGVALYGGFVGTETQLSYRNWQANPTILSGDINNSGDLNGNSLTVVTGSGTDNTAVLDGFTVTGGNADAVGLPGPAIRGGGMYNDQGSPTINQVIFSGNSAFFGGGLFNGATSNPAISNANFSGNAARSSGGGMYNFNSNPVLTNVIFSGNAGNFGGGGMTNEASQNPILTNVLFRGNSVNFGGGGIYNLEGSSPTLTNVSFSGNSALQGAGMFNTESSHPLLTNASFSGNRASESGGAVANSLNSNPDVRNSVFWNNRDQSGIDTSSASIHNEGSTPRIAFSLVQNCNPNGQWNHQCGSFGDSNTNLPDADPLFIMPVDLEELPNLSGNLRLRVGSPAIDVGNNQFVDGVATDLDGRPRIFGARVDLGAYEGDFADRIFQDRFRHVQQSP